MNKNCSNCANAGRPAYDYPCNVCATGYNGDWTMWEKKEELVTNADRIRAMSDEELAEYIYKHFNQDYDVETFLKWLREPREE